MKLSIIAAFAFGLLLSVGTVSAQEAALDLGTIAPVLEPAPGEEKKPIFEERLKGAQDQFLQHQAQVRERAVELKDDAAARVESIRTNVMERHATVQETATELQNTDPKERGALMRANLEERKVLLMEKRAAFASTTAERREKFVEKRGELTAERFDHAIQLMNAMVLRLSGLADRIDARISAVAANGGDTSAAESALDSARDSIAAAESAVSVLADAIADALASETPRESLQASRALADDAKEAIRAAHEALTSAVAALPRLVESGT